MLILMLTLVSCLNESKAREAVMSASEGVTCSVKSKMHSRSRSQYHCRKKNISAVTKRAFTRFIFISMMKKSFETQSCVLK